MRSRSSFNRVTLGGLALAAFLAACAASEPVAQRSAVSIKSSRLPPAPQRIPSLEPAPSAAPAAPIGSANQPPVPDAAPEPPAVPEPPAAPDSAQPPLLALPPAHCLGVPPLGPDGVAPPAPPHLALGQEVDVPNDRPLYLLPGEPGDARVIVYLHGMCGDVTAADYFREAVRAHGSLLALRGDTPCPGDRFKWRDDPVKILQRIRAGLKRVNELNGSELELEGALLFGYSQGADRAEKLAAEYPKLFPRIVLGGPPMRASPVKLARAKRVAILGGELETTETMHAGFEALQAAAITCRFFTLDCAYHGRYGTHAETQLLEVLDWLREP